MAGVFSNALEMIKELSTPHAVQYLEPIWSGVYKQLQKLRESLLQIQLFIEDAEERQLTDKAVRYWLLLLKDAVYDAEDILDEAKTHELVIQRKAQLYGRPRSKVREFFSLDHNPLLFKLQLGKKLSNVNERINELIEEMGKFKLRVLENNNKPLKNRPQTYSYVDESPVIFGRDEDKGKLLQMLISDCFDEKVAVVSIVGIGGLGKTTLAQLVYRDEEVQKHFQLHIWVCVSDDFDVPKLAGKIIHTTSGELCNHTNMEVLQQKLRKELGQKRYLLVLDDVWNEDFQKWDALRSILLDGGDGSRILVTTRNEKCSRLMGVQKPYILSRLSEENSWVLFEQKAFAVGAPKPLPKLVEIGQQIVKKCQGLPLAIQVLGCIMHYKSKESEWQAVLENIETWKLQHTKNKIMPELWLSYVDLATHLKKCFAFCAIFPKDHDIEEEQLIQFWMAHGFIPSQKGTDMEVEGREIFTELIRRSLLQKGISPYLWGKESVYKMHDLIHDLAHFVNENECFTSLKSSAAPKVSISPRRLTFYADEIYSQGDCSTIHTVLHCGRDLSVLSKLKVVRVLDLSQAFIDELPASIEHLHHLRYLDLSFTHIKKLPESICMLVNLQTLKLYGCYQLPELPKSITYMNSLRHFHFDYCLQFEAFAAGLSRLQNLKTVSGYTVGDAAENKLGQLKSFNPFGELALYNLRKVKTADDAREADLGNKQHIRTLKLSWGKLSWGDDDDECCLMENAEEVLEALEPHNNLKELRVSYYAGNQFPIWMSERQQFQYLHHMELFACRKCEQLPPLELLPCLEDLRISQMDGIKHIVNNKRGNTLQPFPALKHLSLSGMRNLEGWCVEEGRGANRSLFPRLTMMDITRCPKLTTMPLEILPCLEDLSISEMDGIKHIINSRRGNALQSFPALKTLELRLMKNLEGWCVEGREANLSLFSCLIRMEIVGCPKLTTMPLEILSRVEYLRMFEMDGIKHIVNNRRGNTLQSFSVLKKLTFCKTRPLAGRYMKEGREAIPRPIVMNIDNCNQLYLTLVLQNLASLKHLHVSKCDTLRELPMCPKSVKTLTIDSCPGIGSLWPEMGHLTSLSRLEVSNCPKLVSLSDGMQALTSLQYLSITYCPALESFPEGLQQLLPTLKSLRIEGCPELERLCKPGGDYCNLLSTNSYKQIGVQPEQTIQVPHEIGTGGRNALECITTNRFLLSAILVCAIACFIDFLPNELDTQVPLSPLLFFYFLLLVLAF
ncbi:putative disease resistance protein RGA3 [Dioscorea cayenensis subsp. rotundata]|uniref:Disease resistance protein RGA3 n=1 Tax=Dioscorea cayennensis subsp. rotundata TaxID=55577 RepID=A0AB40BQS1_DIOCR|nr:putative disease resistance protein RGA3 [Dioscorea cayenensis subsp. rotundata]